MRQRRKGTLEKVEPPVVAGRVPPNDLDAEAAVLAAVLLERDVLARVLEILKPEYFYSEANGRIFEAASRLLEDGSTVDIVSVASWLRDRDRLAGVGGAKYLAQLSDATPAVANVMDHAAIVHEKWRTRQLIATCQRVAAEAYGDTGPTQDFISAALESVEAIATNGVKAPGEVLGAVLQSYWAKFDAKPIGFKTGYVDIDRKLGGLQPGRKYVIGARPGVGKSSLARGIGRNVAALKEEGVPRLGVVIFALEMMAEETAIGMLCTEAHVDQKKLGAKFCNAQEYRDLSEASATLANLPIVIDDQTGLTAMDIRARAKMYAREFQRRKEPTELGLIIIDQIQLVRTAGRPGSTRQQELGEVSRSLKNMAKDMKVPVIELAALNRDSEKEKRRPVLSDLRECGDLESDADVVAFLHRDMRTPEERAGETGKGRPRELPDEGVCEFIIRKARVGETGIVGLRFTPHCTRFDSLAESFSDD